MQDLIQIVDAAVADAYCRGGNHLVCHPGCSQCCIGVFPVSHLDAARLRQGMAALDGTEPERADQIRQRVAASLTRLVPDFPGDPLTGILSQDDEASARFDDFANDESCPVLDAAKGTCDLYAHRPVLCRTFGPPARTEEGDLAHCELCFLQATNEEIAEAEMDPTLPDTITHHNRSYDETQHLGGETLIVFALRDA